MASSVDGTVRRFDVRGGCAYVDQMHAAVTSMALSNDGNCVLASCLDARLRLLDKGSGELLAEYKGMQSLCVHVMVCHIACAQSCVMWSNATAIAKPLA